MDRAGESGYSGVMRHTVGIRDLRDSLSRWIDRVREGDEVVVTDHGKPVAMLSAPKERPKARTEEEHLARLEEEGVIVRPTKPFGQWKPLVILGVSLSDAVLEDREEGD